MITNNYEEPLRISIPDMINNDFQSLQENLFGSQNNIFDYLGYKIEPLSFEQLNFFYNVLMEDPILVPFEFNYRYKPSYVSIEYYNTTKLTHVIMFANKVNHPADFTEENTKDIIIVPTIDAIKEVARSITDNTLKVKTITREGEQNVNNYSYY